ncbi:glycoside hydrolase family 5 protein [Treponema sp.]|uniref:glycoside hydrolase family 5 protein n=1 Tax=Treponema sp. TaxID=166 RepID=UPI00298DC29D|nr:glycoside hydrolase family 5 protein [Treponema sp.]MCR5613625.1 glycoside hydrolase family 5 protein [Treponema sp.]
MKRKLFTIITAAVLTCLLFSCKKENRYAADTHKAVLEGKTVVERYGNLQVIGADLCNEKGEPVQLRGMSSHGLQWYGKYANKNVITWLRDDWNCQLWRAALYTYGGYIGNPVLKEKVIDSIEACIDCGMYVLVDWHVLNDRDPLLYQKQAEEFFDEISKTYGDKPNIIYEICNEPNGDDITWKDNIKPYAEKIIQVIRKNDPDNIIIVGTPVWSSDVTSAAEDPILNQKNIMYTLHFYAGSHGSSRRGHITKAIKKGLPIFVTEWGCTKESGDGGVFEKETMEWIKYMEENNISWTNWSVNNKGEDSGVLVFNADRDAKGGWKDKDLSKAGKFIRRILRNELTYDIYKEEQKKK